jgi:hypothetical protein
MISSLLRNPTSKCIAAQCVTFCNCHAKDEVQPDLYWEKSIQPIVFDEEDSDEDSDDYDEEADYGEYMPCPGCGGPCLD